MTDAELVSTAQAHVGHRVLSQDVSCGGVAAALLTDNASVFTGLSIDANCSIGFCAEHAAIAAMVTAGESRIDTIVAVGDAGRGVIPPCGRCREFIAQLGHPTRILLPGGRSATIDALLPEPWPRAQEE